MIRVLVLLLALALALPAAAQAPEPRVSWDPADPDIGDILMLTVEIDVPENLLVTFPRIDDDAPGFAITGRLAAEPEQNVTGQRRWRQSYRIEPQTTGQLVLPDLAIVVHDPNSMAETRVPLSGIAIPVRSLVAPDADHRLIRDVRGPLRLSPPGTGDLPWAYVVAAAVLIAGVALFLVRRRQPPAVATATASPRDEALRALTVLDPQTETDDRFHTELSGILRTYLDRAFAIAAPRRTTSEAIGELRARGADGADLLGPALAQCDRVKFARGATGADARNRALDAVLSFVKAGEA